MVTITLTLVDWLIIAVYFAFVIGIGFYLKRFTKSQEDFFLAGRKNSAWWPGSRSCPQTSAPSSCSA